MPDIQQLDNHVAELIAAGEVVERPASVVKELVENAIDAGATAITVELQRGGMGLIRITDNGCGIAPHQLPTAFLRHATSKLRRAEELAAIGTLGFRGEALAAIAAVSRLDILSRERGTQNGASLHLEGGTPETVEPAGAPEGTTISVRDLFFNTPARMKFMKKDSAETSAALGLMQHLALSHPDISFRFRKDGEDALHTPGDGKGQSAVYAALGREFAMSLTEVSGRGGDITVRGFVTRPLCGRGSRGMQTFFVNGRYVKSQLLTAALEEGYRNQLMKGKFPGCVLHIDLPAEAVDVNVHPAKTQVKFASEREVFSAVYHTVLDALEDDGKAAVSAKAPAASAAEPPNPHFFQTMDAKSFRETGGKAAEKPVAVQQTAPAPAAPTAPVTATVPVTPPAPFHGGARATRSGVSVSPPPPFWDTEQSERATLRDSAPAKPVYETSRRVQLEGSPMTTGLQPPAEPSCGEASVPAFAPAHSPAPVPPPVTETVQEELPLPQAAAIPKGETPWRLAGEVLHTYIFAEDGQDNVWLIDKHAAHERLNFDRLRANPEPVMRQQLLAPAAVELPGESYGVLLEQLALLEEFGFGAEDFGAGCILVREIPSDIDPAQITEVLELLADKLLSGASASPTDARDAMLHTMACKAAIKGGWTSDRAELQVLVEKVQSGEVRYCPHGRPVAVKISKYELEKMFKRA